jgi:hypothetical protein
MLGVPETVLRAVSKVPGHPTEVVLGAVGLNHQLEPIDADSQKRYVESLERMAKPVIEENLPF